MLTPFIEKNEAMCVERKESWMDPIKAHLKNQTFLKDKKKAEKNQEVIISLLLGE